MKDCSLCSGGITNSQLLYENELMYVVYPRKPQVYGHLMIVPKRHVHLYGDITNQEAISLKEIVHHILSKFTTSNQTIGFNLLSNNGSEEVDQHVPHVHIHMFVRFQNDVNPFKVLSKKIPREDLTKTEWKKRANEIRQLLK
jgi:diadenosine tetraphosphate (Ap4A) HIT family hydrolase